MAQWDKPINTFSFQYDLKVTICPCGSGKKPEKCCGPAKPRTYSVELDPRNYYKSDALAIGLDHRLKRIVNGELKPLIGTPIFSQSYKRKKNYKVLVKGDSVGEYVMNPESVLLGFDHLFAVDTNTVEMDGHQVSMTGVVYASIEEEGESHVLNITPLTLFEFWDAEVKPEQLGWYALIQAIMGDNSLDGGKVALVVDSELDNLGKMNKGLLPLLGDFYLPQNVTLIYASADSGANNANKLIKLSDRMSGNKLKEVKKNRRSESLNETDYPCAWSRQWLRE